MCNDRPFCVVILEGYSVAGVYIVVLGLSIGCQVVWVTSRLGSSTWEYASSWCIMYICHLLVYYVYLLVAGVLGISASCWCIRYICQLLVYLPGHPIYPAIHRI